MNDEEYTYLDDIDGAVTPPPVITDPVTPPDDRVSMTKAELAELVKANMAEAISNYQRPQAPVSTVYDPASDAVHVIRQSSRMATEALNLFSDLPEKYKEQIQEKLDQIPPDQVSVFRDNGLHKTIARDIAMRAIEEGEYTPPKFKGKESPRIEPIGGGTSGMGLSQNGVPKASVSEINELYAFLGLPKPDDTKLKQCYNEPPSSGFRS